MIYNSKETINPFWSENSGFMTGRDPLGIQNSSITVYGRLLPGMTNLTQRLRYYGIYCWLLKEYDMIKIPNDKKSLKHQYNFIRRAELIIAFMMVNEFPDEKSVIGSNYANDHINDDIYNIIKGADKIKNEANDELYWEYDSGALGQYYAGSLINLNLVETVDKFFHIKERGLLLASAFEKSISKATRDYFLSLILDGETSSVKNKIIKPFSLNSIPFESEEWFYYKDILLENDGDNYKTSDGAISSKRRETIGLFLSYLNGEHNFKKFDEWAFQEISNKTNENPALLGWYYYFINEAFHFSIETIFWGMLVSLDGRIILINDFIEEIKNCIVEQNCESLKIDNKELLENVVLTMDSSNLIEELDILEKLTESEKNWKIAIGKAVELISKIYIQIEPKLEIIKDFENKNFINYQKGNVIENTNNYLLNFFPIPYYSYVEKIIKLLMNDHIATAYRKMGNGEVSLLKFIIEDNVIGHIQTMPPKHTNPRISTLKNFLRDMLLINETGEPTVRGNEILRDLIN